MPITVDGVEATTLTYNGQEYNTATLDGVVIFNAGPTVIEVTSLEFVANFDQGGRIRSLFRVRASVGAQFRLLTSYRDAGGVLRSFTSTVRTIADGATSSAISFFFWDAIPDTTETLTISVLAQPDTALASSYAPISATNPLFMQVVSSTPTVMTNAASNILNTSIRLNGSVVSTGDATVTSRGFYWLAGNQTAANTITNGTRVDATAGNDAGFSAVISGLTINSSYTFVAWAVNTNGEGTATNAVSATTGQTVVTTTVDWVPISTGDCTGGTAGTTTFGSYGAWTGATDIMVNSSGIATSASCGTEASTCAVSRSRTSSTPFTGGTQNVQYQCTVIVQGTTSTPSCTAPTGDGTTSTVGSFDNRSQSCNYTMAGTDTQGLNVTNDDEGPGVGTTFTQAAITVSSCTVAQDGTATVVTNFGTTSATNLSPNTGSSSIDVNVNFSVSGTIPAGFEEAGVGTFSFSSAELGVSPCPASQPGLTATGATVVSWDQASVSFNQGTAATRTVGANANGTWTVLGGGNNVSITPSSGNGDTTITFTYDGTTQTRNGRGTLSGDTSGEALIEIDFGF